MLNILSCLWPLSHYFTSHFQIKVFRKLLLTLQFKDIRSFDNIIENTLLTLQDSRIRGEPEGGGHAGGEEVDNPDYPGR